MSRKSLARLIVCSLVALAFGYLLLPYFCDHILLPRLLEKLDYDTKVVRLTRISPWSLNGSLQLGGADAVVNVPVFTIKYTLADLLKGQISAVRIESAVLHLEEKDGELALRGMEGMGLQKSPVDATKKSKKFSLANLAIAVKRLHLHNSTLFVHKENKEFHFFTINGDLDLSYKELEGAGKALEKADANLVVHGTVPMILHLGSTLQKDRGYTTSFTATIEDSGALLKILPGGIVDAADGQFAVSGSISTSEFGDMDSYQVTMVSPNLALKKGGIECKADGGEEEFSIHIEGNKKRVDAKVSAVSFFTPERNDLQLNLRYVLATKEFRGKALVTPALTKAPIHADFRGVRRKQSVYCSSTMAGDGFVLGSGVDVSPYSGEGFFEIGAGRIKGALNVNLPQIGHGQSRLILQGIELNIPLNYPILASDPILPGSITIDKIKYRKEHVAVAKASVVVEPQKLTINSQITTPLHSSLSVSCSSSLAMNRRAKLNCYLPSFVFASESFSPLLKLPDGLSLAGKVEGELRVDYAPNSFSGQAKLNYGDGTVTYNDFNFTEIALGLNFPHLPDLRSSPGQLCTIGKIDLGKIELADARIHLRVDDKETLFIERARLKWCGGRVETGALTLGKEMEKIETTLYCDRLGYTELLGQFGLAEAEGEGALNGRLPIVVSREGVLFDDGFLFSTPGNSGIVRFSNTEELRQGMGGGEKSVYLDYSLKALENFSYNWTKLRFNTEGEELLLALQLDGKPAEPLPYGYQQGQIVKTDKGPGLQHPIRLDVNFRLPLNEMFHYGKSIKSIMEKM